MPLKTPILLGRPALRDFQITLFDNGEWEFMRQSKVKEFSSKQFSQLLRKSPAEVYEIRCCYIPELMPLRVASVLATTTNTDSSADLL